MDVLSSALVERQAPSVPQNRASSVTQLPALLAQCLLTPPEAGVRTLDACHSAKLGQQDCDNDETHPRSELGISVW